jgi:two-component system CheB/CheR fusion protein
MQILQVVLQAVLCMSNIKQPLDPSFEALLDYLKRNRGFDFSGYKRTSLMRRVEKRMSSVGLDDFAEYIDYLEVHPGEFAHLFNTVLINVTSFFRDKEAWAYLQQEIIPRIVKQAGSDGLIRAWSAGCASGEEAYTLAILLCEALGIDEFHKRVKIYATDIDEDALMQARQASYAATDVENLPPEFLPKYFTNSLGRYVFRPDLRRSIIFGRHDLVQDAPISHLDLLICRNTLMYLNAETQRRILARMHFALRDNGFLFLGKAEMLLSHSSLFSQVDLQYRVFHKVNKVNLRDRLLVMAQAGDLDSANYLDKYNTLRELSFENILVGQLAIDRDGLLVAANERARGMFGLLKTDIGRPFQDLEVSYRPLELRSLIDQAYNEQRPIKATKVPRSTPLGVQFLEAQVMPLVGSGGIPIGVTITFEDVTEFHNLYDDLQSAHEELETTNEELQSTNEELETTNEELQSTNEELETTNEELQSTNEELETTNEELQSTNEELETTNEELRLLSEEVHETNMLLHSILSTMRSAVIVVDKDQKILVWNNKSEDLWGLRADEVIGSKLADLDIGLPTEELTSVLSDGHKESSDLHRLKLTAVNRRGRQIHCSIRITPLLRDDNTKGSVIFIDETSSSA